MLNRQDSKLSNQQQANLESSTNTPTFDTILEYRNYLQNMQMKNYVQSLQNIQQLQYYKMVNYMKNVQNMQNFNKQLLTSCING